MFVHLIVNFEHWLFRDNIKCCTVQHFTHIPLTMTVNASYLHSMPIRRLFASSNNSRGNRQI